MVGLGALGLTAGGNDEIKNTNTYFLFSVDLRGFPFLFAAFGDGNEKMERRVSLLEGVRP
jgi:hypothetical protein